MRDFPLRLCPCRPLPWAKAPLSSELSGVNVGQELLCLIALAVACLSVVASADRDSAVRPFAKHAGAQPIHCDRRTSILRTCLSEYGVRHDGSHLFPVPTPELSSRLLAGEERAQRRVLRREQQENQRMAKEDVVWFEMSWARESGTCLRPPPRERHSCLGFAT